MRPLQAGAIRREGPCRAVAEGIPATGGTMDHPDYADPPPHVSARI